MFSHITRTERVIISLIQTLDALQQYPPYLYTLIENFCLGTRRLELFGSPLATRRGWVTAGLSAFSTLEEETECPIDHETTERNAESKVLHFDPNSYSNMLERADGKAILPFHAEIDSLRPKSPQRRNRPVPNMGGPRPSVNNAGFRPQPYRPQGPRMSAIQQQNSGAAFRMGNQGQPLNPMVNAFQPQYVNPNIQPEMPMPGAMGMGGMGMMDPAMMLAMMNMGMGMNTNNNMGMGMNMGMGYMDPNLQILQMQQHQQQQQQLMQMQFQQMGQFQGYPGQPGQGDQWGQDQGQGMQQGPEQGQGQFNYPNGAPQGPSGYGWHGGWSE